LEKKGKLERIREIWTGHWIVGDYKVKIRRWMEDGRVMLCVGRC
jgi:hypothetical protein